MKKSMIAAVALSLAAGLVSETRADERTWNWSPLGIGLFAPVQLPWMSTDVYGLRFGGLLGINQDVYGLDCGLVQITRGDFAGIQLSGFDWTAGEATGLRVSAIANVSSSRTLSLDLATVNVIQDEGAGMQAGVFNYASSFTGFDVGVANWTPAEACGFGVAAVNVRNGEFVGLDLAALNMSQDLCGLQIGAINYAHNATGVQIGVINAAQNMHGVQIGALNMICNGPLPLMVVLNASF